jgi:hypothetical protein
MSRQDLSDQKAITKTNDITQFDICSEYERSIATLFQADAGSQRFFWVLIMGGESALE